jgi:hypothetical protein
MAKTLDDYSGFKIETVKPKAAPRKRRFKLSLLFWLLLGWALIVRFMDKAGSLSAIFGG